LGSWEHWRPPVVRYFLSPLASKGGQRLDQDIRVSHAVRSYYPEGVPHTQPSATRWVTPQGLHEMDIHPHDRVHLFGRRHHDGVPPSASVHRPCLQLFPRGPFIFSSTSHSKIRINTVKMTCSPGLTPFPYRRSLFPAPRAHITSSEQRACPSKTRSACPPLSSTPR
jgi:hypothetical protein